MVIINKSTIPILWRYKTSCQHFLFICFYFIFVPPNINTVPLSQNFDIWGDQVLNNSINIYENNATLNSSFERLPRVLNFFPVPFEEECLSNDRRRKGVCMNAYECRIQEGSSYGKCALGFGVCCVFTTTCDREVINNITYFVNPDFPDLSRRMTSCKIIIQKVDPDIAQLRLDFIHFNLGQPNRRTGICDNDAFTLTGGISANLNMCGLNSGQHAYFDVENVNESITIDMNFGSQVLSRLWEVRIEQIPFTQRAPAGCLQYHMGNKGVIQTMNFAENGRHLANQDYKVCMRQEEGMCSIAYEPCHENAFKIGPAKQDFIDDILDTGSGDGLFRATETCSDRILMPCDSEDLLMPGDLGPGFCDLVHCGGSFCPSGEVNCRIESSITPFTIGVQFGAANKEESPEDNLGMCLKYEQLPCLQ